MAEMEITKQRPHESSALLGNGEAAHTIAATTSVVTPRAPSTGRGIVVFLSVVAAVAGLSSLASSHGRTSVASTILDSTERSAKEMGHRLTAHNEYTSSNGFAGKGYEHLSEGSCVEPHRFTTLIFKVPDSDEVDTSVGPVWNVTYNPTGKNVPMVSGVVVEAEDGSVEIHGTIVFTDIGSHHVTVTIPLTDGTSYTVVRGMYSHYVRRSIRKLTSSERSDFFNSFLIMYQTNTSVGHTIYGGNYKGLRDFVGAHLSAAGMRNADSFHDGMGFLTQHAALTNEMEASLQSITSYISMPFWDYTEDGEMVHDAQDVNVAWEQELWDKSWFGNATGSGHYVKEGRFAYQKAYTSDDSSVVTNPYGFMRAPWNVGKSTHVTRVHKFCETSLDYMSWPFCPDHYNLTFGDEGTTFYDWIWIAGYVPHGPIHYYIGGYTNCGDLTGEFEKIGLGQAEVNDFAQWMIFLPKNFWRSYATESPDYCSYDSPQTDCHMKCLLDYNNKEDVAMMMDMMYGNVYTLGSSGRVANSASWLKSLNESQSAGLMKIYCETPFTPGEQIEAASPIDPSFWPIHPTMERLMQYKRMVNDFTDTEWANSFDDDTSYCTQGGNSMDANEYMGKKMDDDRYGTECDGHHADDMTMFKTVVETSDGTYKKLATSNVELFHMINPTDYQVSYIYEDFTWSHCTGMYEFEETSWGQFTLE